MAAVTASLLAAAQVPFRDLQYRQETWTATMNVTGIETEWLDVGNEILGVIGIVYIGAGIEPAVSVVLNASGSSITAGTNPGNLGIETNSVSGTHTFNITVITRPS